MASFRHVVLLMRDLPKATNFYTRGLGLSVRVASDTQTELTSAPALASPATAVDAPEKTTLILRQCNQ
jgi:catechol 2,3-dioxygenase-like lactoylglutathione lyase family enzyme